MLNKLQITEPNEGKYCPYFLLGAAIVVSRPYRRKGLAMPLLADVSRIYVVRIVS